MSECSLNQIKARTATTALDIKPIMNAGTVVAHEYSLTVAVAGNSIESVECDDSYSAEEKILQVSVSARDNKPVLNGEINVGALNAGLKHAGNAMQLDAKLVRQAKACFSDNLARTVIELARRDKAYITDEETAITPVGTVSAAVGGDLLASHSITGSITLTSLDAIASVIQQGINSCKAAKVR